MYNLFARGAIDYGVGFSSTSICSTIYLKTNVKIVAGFGSINQPFVIGI